MQCQQCSPSTKSSSLQKRGRGLQELSKQLHVYHERKKPLFSAFPVLQNSDKHTINHGDCTKDPVC